MQKTVRTTIIALGVILGLVLGPGVSLAQKSNAKAAKKLLTKGNKLFAAGDYPEAFKAFEQGYKLRPSPVFLRSMAYCQLKMYQHGEARKLMKRYQKKYPRAKDKGKMAEIVSGLDVVIKTKITIETVPQEADVYIDAEAAGKVGKTNYSGTIHPGTHTLILKKAGYYTTTHEFTINAKQDLKVKLKLKVPLQINTNPPGATVHMGKASSKSIGTTPFSGGIEPGKYTVHLKLKDYRTRKLKLSAKGGSPAKLSSDLFVGLKVASAPPGAKILLDGKVLKGVTPMVVDARPGRHKLQIKMAGFTPVTREVDVQPGSGSNLSIRFKGGLLSMRTSVKGATVVVGPVKMGASPLAKATVPLGKHVVRVTHPSRRSWSHPMDFTADQHVTAELKMGHPMAPFWISAGVSAVGLLVGTVTGVMAMKHVAEANDQGRCAPDGAKLNLSVEGDCGFGLQHTSTAGFITGGVAAGVALVYYLLWARDSVKISRTFL